MEQPALEPPPRLLGVIARGDDGRLRSVPEAKLERDQVVAILRTSAGDVMVVGGYDETDECDRSAVVALVRDLRHP